MQTFKLKFKKTLAFLIASSVYMACYPVFAETAPDIQDMHHEQASLDWPGLYYGFMPCADCKGVKTTLALNTNNTYVLSAEYVGKSIREFVEKGKFAWSDKKDTIILTPRKGDTTPQQYLVGEDKLVKLDENGNPFAGELVERYTLRRKDVTATPQSHSSH
jgi:uncharacterized lipoprotein NlpE involved in copper resistance